MNGGGILYIQRLIEVLSCLPNASVCVWQLQEQRGRRTTVPVANRRRIGKSPARAIFRFWLYYHTIIYSQSIQHKQRRSRVYACHTRLSVFEFIRVCRGICGMCSFVCILNSHIDWIFETHWMWNENVTWLPWASDGGHSLSGFNYISE